MLLKESWLKSKRLFKVSGLILLIFGLVFWLRSDFWQIKKVSCYLNGDVCSLALWAELANKTLGKNIVIFSSSKLGQEIKQNHPEFLQLKINKRLPNGLFFKIEIRKTVVAIGREEGDFYLADKEGILLERTNNPGNLPLIFLPHDINQDLGTKIQEELILTAIQILYGSKLRLLEPESARLVSEKAIEVRLKEDLQVLFSTKKEVKAQLDSLQFILKRAKIEGKRLERIDLRFDKPVIVE